MDAFLKKIESTNPHLNALVNLIPRDECLRLAREADATPYVDAEPGWLHGIPVAVKDLSRAKDWPQPAVSLFRDEIATYDDPHVAHLRRWRHYYRQNQRAGMGIRWAHRQPLWFNPERLDPELSAGGSSGGAASALASGMLSIADGSDMMGSLRTPAAFQGLVGFRPTPGVVPLAPEMDQWSLVW